MALSTDSAVADQIYILLLNELNKLRVYKEVQPSSKHCPVVKLANNIALILNK